MAWSKRGTTSLKRKSIGIISLLITLGCCPVCCVFVPKRSFSVKSPFLTLAKNQNNTFLIGPCEYNMTFDPSGKWLATELRVCDGVLRMKAFVSQSSPKVGLRQCGHSLASSWAPVFTYHGNLVSRTPVPVLTMVTGHHWMVTVTTNTNLIYKNVSE